ncbi:MAG: 5'-nucleotidase C-terminal domain-containing protein [Gemmatimonadota bacterium]|nr:5'-nucleotidase C-terminal domain-containing protein [Gemmatimonadota bacterium]
MVHQIRSWSPTVVLLICLLTASGAASAGEFRLTILHNNDGESQLINAGEGLEDFGGVDRFKTLADQLKAEARLDGGVLMVSSGDNFLAGPEFNVSLQRPDPEPFYDALAMDLIGYDAVCIGNHDFDFGPDTLARFISGYRLTRPPYLSANLDFGDEPELAALVASGQIAGSTVVRVDGEHIGIVGATTPDLAFISSPRNVRVDRRLREAIQAEVNGLTLRGVRIIVLISHLQSIDNDLELVRELRGVDVVIAGGGDEVLANPGTRLIPGDEVQISGPYPILEKGADGNDVHVVTTAGNYRYVGRFVASFNAAGFITSVDRNACGPVRVAGGDRPDAVVPDAGVRNRVVGPVSDALASLATNQVGTSEVVLDGVRSRIRTRETNEGNLVADALRWQSAQLASSFGVPVPQVGIVNGGGIRNANEIPAGAISELTTFDMLPFPNFVTVVPAVPAAQFREIMENAVSKVERTSGRFAQISGLTMAWNPDGVAQELDESGNVTRRGGRIVEITLDTGAGIVRNGNVVSGAPDIPVATVDFLAGGGDQYPYRGARFTRLGVTYQQALVNFIREGLDGRITAAAYPEGGQGRITTRQPIHADESNLANRSVVHVFLTRDGGPIPHARVEFSRSVSGRARDFRWMGTTDAEGSATIEIRSEGRRSVSGYYAVRAVDIAGNTISRWESVPINGGREITLLLPVGGVARVEDESPLAPETLALYPNTPNPFNPSTRIVYRIHEPAQVDLTIYNLLGQQVRVLVRDHQSPGRYEVLWDGKDGFGRYASSGVYFYRLAHPGGAITNRMLLVK